MLYLEGPKENRNVIYKIILEDDQRTPAELMLSRKP